MHRRAFAKLAALMIPVLVGGLLAAGSSLAGNPPKLGAVKLGNGPKSRPKAPRKFSLSTTQPLISMQFDNGKLSGVSGTAVRPSLKMGLGATPQAFKHVRCTVNFTNSRLVAGNETAVTWFAGIGCGRPLVLFGQAYLQQSAGNVNGVGTHYQDYASSAASGDQKTIVNARHPSLYIRHLLNVYFLNPGGSGRISLYPAPGQRVNGASVCSVATTKLYGLGVHCDLYSNRF